MWQTARRQAKMNATSEPENPPSCDNARLAEQIEESFKAAQAELSPVKIEETVSQWFSRNHVERDEAAAAVVLLEAFALACQLLLFTPSLTGVRPIDRSIRQRAAEPEGSTARTALAKARFHLLRMKSRTAPDTIIAEDLADGVRLSLFDSEIPEGAMNEAIAAYLAPLPDGGFFMIGSLTPLDTGAVAEGLSFVRPGKGLSNPQRCAAAVYRYVVRHGGPRLEGVNDFPADLLGQLGGMHEDEGDDLDRLAFSFEADLSKGQEPGAGYVNEARRLTSMDALREVLARSVISRQFGRSALADAFSRIAFIMMETFERRAAAGTGEAQAPFEFIAAALDREIAENKAPADARTLYEDLRRRLGASARKGANKSESDAELARVLQRIQALRAKTVEQGCTEQEALASAKKVAELLDRYGLSLGEVEMRDQTCEGVGIETGRRKRTPLDECVPTIGYFCDCKVWSETAASGAIRYVFFGLPADVEAAHYLYDLVTVTFATETARFKKDGANIAPSSGRGTTHSFQIGLAHGICEKLASMKKERDDANRLSSGRDLVPIKASIIEDELQKLGMDFSTKSVRRKRFVEHGAYEAGRSAGRKFTPHRGVEGAA
jgi:hypothetical protein